MTATFTETDPLVAKYLRASRSENTRRAYESDLSHFIVWGGTLPCSADLVARYLAQRAAHLKPSTLRRHLAAIGSAHRDLAASDPTKAELIRRVMQGIARKHGAAPRKVRAISLTDLARMVAAVEGHMATRDRAIILTGFFAALRRSELAALKTCDVTLTPNGAGLSIRKSKTDQISAGRVVQLTARSDELCPVQALEAHLRPNAPMDGALFAGGQLGARPISDRLIARLIKRLAGACELDPMLFAGHSLRAGYITSASEAGFDAVAISRQSGHRTIQALSAYVRTDVGPQLPAAG